MDLQKVLNGAHKCPSSESPAVEETPVPEATTPVPKTMPVPEAIPISIYPEPTPVSDVVC